ncbi:MAG TPA: hypothetical protein PLK76_03590 [bacterium]|nr:hypothetical protein [bacterium]
MQWIKWWLTQKNNHNRIISVVAVSLIFLLILFFAHLAGILFLAKKWYPFLGSLFLVIVLAAMSNNIFKEIKIKSVKFLILAGIFSFVLFIALWMANYPLMLLAKMSASFFSIK